MKKLLKQLLLTHIFLYAVVINSHATQTINEDLAVLGSLGVGTDMTSTYSFGFDTIVLKENNLRLYFDDTSVSSFPSNDWRISINSSIAGGGSFFSIDDATANDSPFKIDAGAGANALHVHSSGRIGFGTATPALELHIKDSDTPGIRLDQDTSGGWTAQTWDVAGNESNFFIRDASHSSTLPFRIQPGASNNSLTIRANNNIGIGTWAPTANLHIHQTVAASDNMIRIQNGLLDTLTLDGSGNLTAAGTISHGSSRSIKKEIDEVNADDILERLLQLDIYTWQYKTDDNITHLGPMAEDFGELFHLGKDNTHLAPGDMGGIAFAAIQSLNEKVTDRDQKISALEKENAELSKRLERLENLVESMIENN